jgi:RNA polymerase sigma-70 factor, ECF subfamily
MRAILLLVRRDVRHTAAVTMPKSEDRAVDPGAAAELELLAQETSARWSGSFVIESRAFVAYLSARLAPGANAEAMRANAADLYLACACSLGIPEAVRIFEATLVSEIAAGLRHLHLEPSAIDELRQMTREKLLVAGAGRAPRIADYTGRGTLRGWTRVVTTRIALNRLRDQKREVPLEDALLEQRATDTCDPELSCLRERFGVALDRALECAMRSLTADERVLLRQRFVDGLTSEQLARFHRKHRITMIRRLNGILRTLRARTEALLASDVGCGHSTAVSIVNMTLSQAHLSIRRYLASHD